MEKSVLSDNFNRSIVKYGYFYLGFLHLIHK